MCASKESEDPKLLKKTIKKKSKNFKCEVKQEQQDCESFLGAVLRGLRELEAF